MGAKSPSDGGKIVIFGRVNNVGYRVIKEEDEKT